MQSRRKRFVKTDAFQDTFRDNLPTEPTSAHPGTEEKILVMQKRVEQRVRLFHPDDAGIDYSKLNVALTRGGIMAPAPRATHDDAWLEEDD